MPLFLYITQPPLLILWPTVTWQWAVCDVSVVVLKVLYLLSLDTAFSWCRFPVNMQDLIGSVLVMSSSGHYSQHAARSHLPESDSVPFFQTRPGSFCAKLAQIQSEWPGQVLAKHVGSRSKLAWCAGIIRAQFWQNATGPLPVSYFQTWLHSSTDGPDQIVQNQPRSDLVLVDHVRFWPNGSGVQESSDCPAQCFRASLDRMWIGSGMFTGLMDLFPIPTYSAV